MKNIIGWINAYNNESDPTKKDQLRFRDKNGNYADEIDPSTMDPTQSAELLKHGVKLPNGKIRLEPEYFIKYTLHSQGRAAFIKSVASLTGTLFDERIIMSMVKGKMPGIQDVTFLDSILIAGVLAKFSGIRKLITKIALPTLLAGATFDMQHQADKLAGLEPDDMPNAVGVLFAKAIMPTDVIDWLSEHVMPVDEATGKVNTYIDKLNDWQKKGTGDPANNSPEVTQANTPDANGNMPPPAPAPTNNAAGYPNLVNENRQYWMQNYNGTRVKNPRTGLWESNKR